MAVASEALWLLGKPFLQRRRSDILVTAMYVGGGHEKTCWNP